MRPIRLKIEGFTSFKTETDIDFSDLEVFAITGDNGAGKSSILEAMLFALYGKTHRLGKEKKDLVSLGCDKAAVMLEFTAGGKDYRVTRSFKPKGNPFMKLEVLKNENWSTLAEQAQVNVEVEKILRLPFDAFTKAVLIPQGHFDALLKPHEPKDRRKILIDLFDLGIYDRMKMRANEIVKRAEGEESEISAQFRNRYADATPDRRKEIAREKKELGVQAASLQKEKTRLQKEQDRVREVLALKSEYATVSARVREAIELRMQATGKAKKALRVLDAAKAVESAEVPLLEKEREGIARSVDNLQLLAQKEAALEEAEAGVRLAESRMRSLESDHRRLESRVHETSVVLTAVQQSVAGHAFREDRYALLESLYDGALRLEGLRGRIDTLASAVEKDSPALAELRAGIASLEAAMKKNEALRQAARRKADEARREGEVLDLKMSLHPGDECPVCGAGVVAAANVSPDRIHKIREAHAAAEEQYASLENSVSSTRDMLTSKTAELRLRSDGLVATENELSILRQQAVEENGALCRKLGIGTDAFADVVIRKEYEAQKTLSLEFRRLQQERQNIEKSHLQSEKALQDCDSDVKVYAARLAQLRAERDRLAEETVGLRAGLSEWVKPGIPVKSILVSMERRRGEIQERLEGLRRTVQETTVALAEIRRDEDHAASEVQRQEAQSSALKAQIDLLTEEEAAMSDLLAETLRSRLQTAEDELSRANRLLGEVTKQLEQMDTLLKEAVELRARLEQVRKDRETYGLLSRHLASNQLQEYVVSMLLEQLVGSANHFLKDLTQGRYLLELQKDSFVVQDSWASGASRIVETLSGGESFVASLALALALSEFVKGGASLESIFIDEGFGSLHRDKLDLVYEALGALSGTGKMIGLVTHIDELASRFPARLQVQNTPSGASVTLVRAEMNW